MCGQQLWPLEIADEVFHCQLGFADHGAPGALDKPEMALFGTCHGSRSRVGGRLWHAGQESLRQSLQIGDVFRVARAQPALFAVSHLVQGRGYTFLHSGQTILPLGQFLLNGIANKAVADANSLRIDSSVTDGMEVETKTEGSDSFVWLPASIDTELEFWHGTATNAMPDAFIFPSSCGTTINTNNFLFRVLKEAGRKAGIEGVTHQMLRRTCSTYIGANHERAGPPPTHERQDNAGALHQNRCLRASALPSNRWISC